MATAAPALKVLEITSAIPVVTRDDVKYGQDELDRADLLRHLDEIGVRRAPGHDAADL